MRCSSVIRATKALAVAVVCTGFASGSWAAPSMVDPDLQVRPWIEGLALPIGMAFLGPGDALVLEKNSGRVLRVTNGVVAETVLDLAVNNASERGLLGIALHPHFPDDPGVYLYWSCRTTGLPSDPFTPLATTCAGPPGLGDDSGELLEVPLLGNRIDRFEWTGSALVFDHNLITLRSFQNDGGPQPPNQGDEGQPPRGNHDAGVIRFGPDGKLYAIVGDLGRRGQLQNLPSGPTATGLGPTVADDQFGGPQPDDAHLAGVILRLNDDGTTPSDNPFFDAGASMGGEVGENLQRIYAYGIRNSFGMAFDPMGGHLWEQENGEDAYDEINRVEAGANFGWIQTMGPLSRVSDYKAIELTSTHGGEPSPNLQQLRWGPPNIAQTPAEARSRLFELPGSTYRDPEFSWKHVIAPAAIGFVNTRALGPRFRGDMLVGLSVPMPEGGPLLRLPLSKDRMSIATDDDRLADRVADNLTFNDLTESESFLIGRDFGVVTDIQTAPAPAKTASLEPSVDRRGGTKDGNVFVVSLSLGGIYEISQAPSPGQAKKGAGPFAAISVSGSPRAPAHDVRLEMRQAALVRVTVHDVGGRAIATLAEGPIETGTHSIAWSSERRPQGVYFIRLDAIASDGTRVRSSVRTAVVR